MFLFSFSLVTRLDVLPSLQETKLLNPHCVKSPWRLQVQTVLVHSAKQWLGAHMAFLCCRHVSQPHLVKNDVPHYRNKSTSAHMNLALSPHTVL